MKAILIQEYFISKRSLEVTFDLFFTAVLSVLVFGFVAVYLARSAQSPAPQFLLVGILLWEIIRVGQYSISVGAMWNVWSRNLSNLFYWAAFNQRVPRHPRAVGNAQVSGKNTTSDVVLAGLS